MNIILITVDCLRLDRCGVYGHHRNTTPTLDEIACEGYVFEQAYATGPVTTESFPGILAGRLSMQTEPRGTISQKGLPEEAPTIASGLREEGFTTGAVLSNPRIGPHVETNRGFDHFTNLRRENAESSDDSPISLPFPQFTVGERLMELRERMQTFDKVPRRYLLPFLCFRYYQYFTGWPSVRGEAVVEEFISTIEGLESPFFAWTHLMDLHGPHHPDTVNKGGLYSADKLSQFCSHAKKVSDIYDPISDGRYDSSLRYVDHQLTRLKNWLVDADLWDETVIIITADHGDALGDRDIYEHPTHYVWDELLHVPLIVRIPGDSGGQISAPMSLGWLHELIAEIANTQRLNVPLTSERDSHLSPGEDKYPTIFADSLSDRGHTIVVRRGSDKFVTHVGNIDENNPKVTPAGQYDLSAHPWERKMTPIDSQLKKKAIELATTPDEFDSNGNSQVIDEGIKDQLKQLGYRD